MYTIIFAGGAGTRLWPLSRRRTPKQFEKLKDDQSTLEMAVERIHPLGLENVYIATQAEYSDIVHEQLPEIATDHVMIEPARRDLAAAVGLALFRLKAQGASGPTAILWADHFMDHPDNFLAALKQGEAQVVKNPRQLVFLGEKARFANHNLGWIKLGQAVHDNVYQFEAWKYRPELEQCRQMFTSHEWVWNPGYFIFDLDFLLELYQVHQPELSLALQKMVTDPAQLSGYNKLPVISFDQAIIEKISPDQAVVLKVNLGWNDPGTLYALKQALAPGETENYIVGNTKVLDSQDCLIYNGEPTKIVTAIGLDGVVVVNTGDALLVCHKDKVPQIKTLLAELEADGKVNYL